LPTLSFIGSNAPDSHLPGASAGTFARFDRMRRKRNNAFYEIALVTDTEAEEAVSAADDFLLLVEADIKKRTP
jgi:hypothetical protein